MTAALFPGCYRVVVTAAAARAENCHEWPENFRLRRSLNASDGLLNTPPKLSAKVKVRESFMAALPPVNRGGTAKSEVGAFDRRVLQWPQAKAVLTVSFLLIFAPSRHT